MAKMEKVRKKKNTSIIDSEFLLFGEQRKGFLGRLTDSASTFVGGGDHQLMEPGEYVYTIDFQVPDSATLGRVPPQSGS